MKIFSDLKANQAVKLDSNLFVVELYLGTYEIASTRVQLVYGNTQVTVQSLDDIKRVVTQTGEVLHYEYTHNGVTETVSVDDRDMLINQINDMSEQYFDEDAEEYIYPDIDVEYEHKKLLARANNYRAVCAPDTITVEPVEITVVGTAVDTKSKFIETPFQYGKVSFGSGVFRVNISAIALDEFNQAKLTYSEAKFENANHSNIRYARVNGTYMFNDGILGAKEDQVRVVTSLAQAQALEKEVRDGISNILRHKLAPVQLTQNILTVTGVMADLESIAYNVKRIDPKSKSYSDHAQAIKKLNELVTKLMKV